ncbi:hypothetical protein BDV06DRAFT_189230 [Aspergillus oleicola]
MSRTRPPKLQAWACLHNRSTPLLPSSARPSLLPAIDGPSRKLNNQTSHPRLFHITPSNHASPAPSTRRKLAQQRSQPARVPFPTKELLNNSSKDSSKNKSKNPPLDDKLKARLGEFERISSRLYTEVLLARQIDPSVDSDTFMRVGAAVLKGAYGLPPSAAAAEGIAQAQGVDLSTVYEIGRVVTRGQPEIHKWLRVSCAKAGERLSNLLIVAHQLFKDHSPWPSVYDAKEVKQPLYTEYIEWVKKFATRTGTKGEGQENRDTQAMLLYAKYLGLLSEYKQALSLVYDVLRVIKPSLSEPRPSEDLTLGRMVEPPWELYLWLQREKSKQDWSARGQDPETTDGHLHREDVSALRLGATEYQDPTALRRYAQHMGRTRGIDFYEEYMGQAAAGGDRTACRHLANLYYLIYMGVYPRLGTSASKNSRLQEVNSRFHETEQLREQESSQGLIGEVFSFFGPRPYHEYLSLAKEWYQVASEKGCFRSGQCLAQIYQQEGEVEKAEATFTKLLESDTLTNHKTREVMEEQRKRLTLGKMGGPKLRNLDL